MPPLYAHSSDGYCGHQAALWPTARDAVTTTAVSSGGIAHYAGISGMKISTRGGGFAFAVYRSYFRFDTSSISSDVESATINLYGFSTNGGDVIALKSSAAIETLGSTDFAAIEGWNVGLSDGSGAGDNEGNVTKYSDDFTGWTTTGYNTITLSLQALIDMRDDDNLYVCMMNYDYDLKDVSPLGYATHRVGVYYQNNTGDSKDPYISYTLAPADNMENTISHGMIF